MYVNKLAYYMEPIKNYMRDLQDKGLEVVAYLDRGHTGYRPNIDIVALDEFGSLTFTIATGIILDYNYPLRDDHLDERALRDLYDDAADKLGIKFGQPDPLDGLEYWTVDVTFHS